MVISLITSERAYLAGLIDGEGCITLVVSNRGQLPQPQLSIANTNLEVLKWVQAKTGCGSICKKMPRHANHSVSYVWQINRAGGVTAVLKTVEEFLIVKKKQANLILKDYAECTPRNGKYTQKTLRKKQILVETIRRLNHR